MRACLKFPIKKYNQVIFAFSFGLFFRFYSIASYPLHKNCKTFSKETLKPGPNKIQTGSLALTIGVQNYDIYIVFRLSYIKFAFLNIIFGL